MRFFWTRLKMRTSRRRDCLDELAPTRRETTHRRLFLSGGLPRGGSKAAHMSAAPHRQRPRLSGRPASRGGEWGEQTLQQACSQAYPGSAICVQSFDDSLNSAIRITYRISLRSSSLREPRYPLLKVVSHWYNVIRRTRAARASTLAPSVSDGLVQ